MPDELQEVTSGDAFRPTAATWNAFIESARAHRGNKFSPSGGRGGNAQAFPLVPALTIMVLNEVGTNIDARSIVRLKEEVIGDPLLLPYEFRGRPIFKVGKPDAADNAIGIMHEPAGTTAQLARCAVAGVIVCDVEIQHASHKYARPIPDVTGRLISAPTGPARILWPEERTAPSTIRCVVHLIPQANADTNVRIADPTPDENGLYAGAIVSKLDAATAWDDDGPECKVLEIKGRTLEELLDDGVTPVRYDAALLFVDDDSGLPVYGVEWDGDAERKTLGGNVSTIPDDTPVKLLGETAGGFLCKVPVEDCEEPTPYTDEDAQDAVGGILDSDGAIYDDVTPRIRWDPLFSRMWMGL